MVDGLSRVTCNARDLWLLSGLGGNLAEKELISLRFAKDSHLSWKADEKHVRIIIGHLTILKVFQF